MRLSDLVNSCKFVQLDNNPDAFLNWPSHFAVSDSFILITDALDKPAKLFTISGRFIRNLGSVGKGPDEYISVISPYIDEESNHF
jgi:hypothetical protein